MVWHEHHFKSWSSHTAIAPILDGTVRAPCLAMSEATQPYDLATSSKLYTSSQSGSHHSNRSRYQPRRLNIVGGALANFLNTYSSCATLTVSVKMKEMKD
jgi:hypothetical protein